MTLKNKLACSVFAGILMSSIGQAYALETTARNVVLMDYDTGQILFAKPGPAGYRAPPSFGDFTFCDAHPRKVM